MKGFQKTIGFIPGHYYPSLSVSGTRCELNCPYCKGKFLEGMPDVSDPKILMKVLETYYLQGARGFLLSGGFNKEGYLMINKEHLRVVRNFKKDHEVVISIHLGLAPRKLAEEAWESGIDFIDYEIPPSNSYIRVMKNIFNRDVEDYMKFLEYLNTLSREFAIPHIVLDSTLSTSKDEELIIWRLSTYKPPLIVALVEIRRTPNNVERVHQALRIMRDLFTEVSLGCMRSPQFKKYDEKWISEGLIDRVAVPDPELVRKALPIVMSCCSIPRSKFYLFPQRNMENMV